MDLYHFTSEVHLERILLANELTTTESNIGAPENLRAISVHPIGDHVGPDVVWLTDDPDASPSRTGLTGSRVDKSRVRFTVGVPDEEVAKWSIWARQQDIDQRWYDALCTGRDDDRWWVIERPVPRREWLEIATTARGENRNARCRCGSGAKYKHCHLGRRLVIWTRS